MSYFVSIICRTTINGNPVIPPTTLGPFKTEEAACIAANVFQEQAFRAQASVVPRIYSDGSDDLLMDEPKPSDNCCLNFGCSNPDACNDEIGFGCADPRSSDPKNWKCNQITVSRDLLQGAYDALADELHSPKTGDGCSKCDVMGRLADILGLPQQQERPDDVVAIEGTADGKITKIDL